MKSLFATNIKGEYNYHTLSMLHLRKSEMTLKYMPALPEFYKRNLFSTDICIYIHTYAQIVYFQFICVSYLHSAIEQKIKLWN